MSADIWLEDEHGDTIILDPSPDAEYRDMVPIRVAGEVTATNLNLTHNLRPMLTWAGLPPWDDIIGRRAGDVAAAVRQAHATLVSEPDACRVLNPPNGWGNYELAVEVIGAMADAFEQHPFARVGGSI